MHATPNNDYRARVGDEISWLAVCELIQELGEFTPPPHDNSYPDWVTGRESGNAINSHQQQCATVRALLYSGLSAESQTKLIVSYTETGRLYTVQ